jgi:hypothetical protein
MGEGGPSNRLSRLDAGDVDGRRLRRGSNELAHDARERDLDPELLEHAAFVLDELLEQRAIPSAQARFFVTENDRLGGKRPLDVLRRGHLVRVLGAASVFGEHGAA